MEMEEVRIRIRIRIEIRIRMERKCLGAGNICIFSGHTPWRPPLSQCPWTTWQEFSRHSGQNIRSAAAAAAAAPPPSSSCSNPPAGRGRYWSHQCRSTSPSPLPPLPPPSPSPPPPPPSPPPPLPPPPPLTQPTVISFFLGSSQ
eukprot:757621-Hanusia_phi.AAC.1